MHPFSQLFLCHFCTPFWIYIYIYIYIVISLSLCLRHLEIHFVLSDGLFLLGSCKSCCLAEMNSWCCIKFDVILWVCQLNERCVIIRGCGVQLDHQCWLQYIAIRFIILLKRNIGKGTSRMMFYTLSLAFMTRFVFVKLCMMYFLCYGCYGWQWSRGFKKKFLVGRIGLCNYMYFFDTTCFLNSIRTHKKTHFLLKLSTQISDTPAYSNCYVADGIRHKCSPTLISCSDMILHCIVKHKVM